MFKMVISSVLIFVAIFWFLATINSMCGYLLGHLYVGGERAWLVMIRNMT